MLRERRRHTNFKPNRRLDRKSSRGMIYENEELRLRTININAEVERGQNDIRKLRRENEQLKREIWNLRDEYDKLHQFLNTNHNSWENLDHKHSNSGSQTEDSCDTCKENDSMNEKSKDNYYGITTPTTTTTTTVPASNISSNESNGSASYSSSSMRKRTEIQSQNISSPILEKSSLEVTSKHLLNSLDGLNSLENLQQQQEQQLQHIQQINFDHLSVVSEENLSNSDDDRYQNQSIYNYGDIKMLQDNSTKTAMQQQEQRNLIRGTTLPQLTSSPCHPLVGSLTITTRQPNNLTTSNNIPTNLNNFSPHSNPRVDTTALNTTTAIPPLSHFENICDEKFESTPIGFNTLKTHLSYEAIKKIDKSESLGVNQTDDMAFTLNSNNNSNNDNNTTTNVSEVKIPKYFFSPIKPVQTSEIVAIQTLHPHKSNTFLEKIPLSSLVTTSSRELNTGPPDICVANVLGSHNNEFVTIKATSKCDDDNLFQNGGNLEELLSDIQNFSNNSFINSATVTKLNDQQYYQQSQTLTTFKSNRNNNELNNKFMYNSNNVNNNNDNNNNNINTSTDHYNLKENKTTNRTTQQLLNQYENKSLPYHRSEINLILKYNNIDDSVTNNNSEEQSKNNLENYDENVKKKIECTSDQINSKNNNNENYSRRDSLPNPMTLFPPQLPYLGFEEIMLPISLGQLDYKIKSSIPTELQSSANADAPAIINSILETNVKQNPPTIISPSNKLNNKLNKYTKNYSNALSEPYVSYESSSGSDKGIKRLNRRVSILNSSQDHNDKKKMMENDELEFTQSEDNLIALNRKLGISQNLSSSTNDLFRSSEKLTTMPQQSSGSKTLDTTTNSIISNKQQQIDSTCNSPHSVNQCFDSKQLQQQHINNSSHHRHRNKSILPLYNQKLSNESSRSTSVISLTTVEDGVMNLTSVQPTSSSSLRNADKYNTSRRHSDGTLITTKYNHNHNHNQHHPHHHQHHRQQHQQQKSNENFSNSNLTTASSSKYNNNNRGFNNSHKNSAISIIQNYGDKTHDSTNNKTVAAISHHATSTSERNSNNSFASSGDSSTSLYMPTSRRKMSNVSHNAGGKIPWCGCWGNGCL